MAVQWLEDYLRKRLSQRFKDQIRPYVDPLRYYQAKQRNRRKSGMADKIRWGIIGTGKIARAFAHGLSFLPDAELLAVGSRAQMTSDNFGEMFGVPRRYPTYEALVSDPDIDAVYISTPHSFHYENMKLCIEAGKPVLCEKPFTINAKQAAEIIDLARQRGVFAMEAMWTRFLPTTARVREWVTERRIGDVHLFQADFGYRAEFN